MSGRQGVGLCGTTAYLSHYLFMYVLVRIYYRKTFSLIVSLSEQYDMRLTDRQLYDTWWKNFPLGLVPAWENRVDVFFILRCRSRKHRSFRWQTTIKVFSPTDAQENGFKRSIKIYIKTAPTCFSAII